MRPRVVVLCIFFQHPCRELQLPLRSGRADPLGAPPPMVPEVGVETPKLAKRFQKLEKRESVCLISGLLLPVSLGFGALQTRPKEIAETVYGVRAGTTRILDKKSTKLVNWRPSLSRQPSKHTGASSRSTSEGVTNCESVQRAGNVKPKPADKPGTQSALPFASQQLLKKIEEHNDSNDNQHQ